MKAYLDNSATTAQFEQVTDRMLEAVREFGNPSSMHSMGVIGEKMVRKARKQAADAAGADADEIIFTSGGTESDNAAIFGGVESLRRQGDHIITTQVEHPAVLECFRRLEQKGMRVTYLNVDRDCLVDPDAVAAAIDEKTILVSVMQVNNETGAIQPLNEIGRIIREKSEAFGHRILFHTDAVQGFGKIRQDLQMNGIDMMSASGHKIHGPKGTGLLYIRKGLHIPAFIVGGGQERGQRSGTENVPGIVGLGEAASIASEKMSENLEHVRKLRDKLLNGIISGIENVRVNSLTDERGLPYILNVSFPGTRGEVLLHMLEQAGIYVSTGSACSSKKKGSHVLSAMGLKPDEIEGAVRFSLSADNTEEEIEYTLENVRRVVADNRRILKIAGKDRRR